MEAWGLCRNIEDAQDITAAWTGQARTGGQEGYQGGTVDSVWSRNRHGLSYMIDTGAFTGSGN